MKIREDTVTNEKMDMDAESDEKKLSMDSWMKQIPNIHILKEKKEKIAIIFLLGIFFLLIATPMSKVNNNKEKQNRLEESQKDVTEVNIEIDEKDEYIESLENKLEQTIEGMEGAGKVLVMITLKDSGEKILDKNQPYESSSEIMKEEGKETEQSSIKSNQETVLVEVEGNTSPIVIQERYPDIEGVVVVCEGGDNSELTLRIKEAVQALFSVDTHKIVVCKLQQ